MNKRILEIISGVTITIFLLGSYGDKNNTRKHFIEYLTTNGLLQIIIVLCLLMLASRLIAGKPKDYSKTCYKLLVRVFGLPKKEG